jgi:hypothetical protein
MQATHVGGSLLTLARRVTTMHDVHEEFLGLVDWIIAMGSAGHHLCIELGVVLDLDTPDGKPSCIGFIGKNEEGLKQQVDRIAQELDIITNGISVTIPLVNCYVRLTDSFDGADGPLSLRSSADIFLVTKVMTSLNAVCIEFGSYEEILRQCEQHEGPCKIELGLLVGADTANARPAGFWAMGDDGATIEQQVHSIMAKIRSLAGLHHLNIPFNFYTVRVCRSILESIPVVDIHVPLETADTPGDKCGICLENISRDEWYAYCEGTIVQHGCHEKCYLNKGASQFRGVCQLCKLPIVTREQWERTNALKAKHKFSMVKGFHAKKRQRTTDE